MTPITLPAPAGKSTKRCEEGVESGDGFKNVGGPFHALSGNEPISSNALFHQAIVQPHQLTVVVILQDKLSRPHLGFFSQQNLGPEVAL
jgi:hypothetical protein